MIFKRHFFLGLAAGRKVSAVRQLFTIGHRRDLEALGEALEARYGGTAVLCKNGRSGLAVALKAVFQRGDGIIVNGFTCYAVVEAVKAAGCVPIYADISRETLNFNGKTLAAACPSDTLRAAQAKSSRSAEHIAANVLPRGIIIQNTLGNPVDIVEIEKFAKKNGLLIIEDLAHCAGVKYPDGREAGTVGVATALSFGKDKSVDTTSGGAVVLRDAVFTKLEGIRSLARRGQAREPRGDGSERRGPRVGKNASLCDSLRARWYPTLAGWCRGLARVHLCGALMRLFVKLHFVEKSADNKLDLTRRCTKWQAKLALKQIQALKKSGEGVIREFYLVNDRDKCLAELKKAGYHFDGFWYEKPVSPERYYEKVHFPEADCPVATEVAAQIINFPTYYKKAELKQAYDIIKPYLVKESE